MKAIGVQSPLVVFFTSISISINLKPQWHTPAISDTKNSM